MFRRAGLLFFALILTCTAVRAQQDPLVGIWKQNLAKSKYEPASPTPPIGTTLQFQASGNNAYKTTADGVDPKGAPTHVEFTATLDGNDYPLTGTAYLDSASVKKLNANTLIIVDKKGGAVIRRERITVSKDGETCTVDQVGHYAQGVAYHNVLVFDKQ